MSKKKGEVLLEPVVSKAPEFNSKWFENCEEVKIGFRLQMKSADHWINKAAIAITRKRSDRYPGGHLCHAELMMQANRGRWYRVSIVKKSCKGRDKEGRMQWLKGTVHCKPVNTASWDAKYRFQNINIPRDQQARMWRCLEQQINAPFNFWGYALNWMLPFGRIGTWSFQPWLFTEKARRGFFCTELLLTLLQAGARRSRTADERQRGWERAVWRQPPNTSNPNLLWRILDGVDGVQRSIEPSGTIRV